MEDIPSGDAAVASTARASSSGARIVFPGDQLAVSGSGIRLGNGLVQASLVTRPGANAAINASSSAAATAAAIHSSLAANTAAPASTTSTAASGIVELIELLSALLASHSEQHLLASWMQLQKLSDIVHLEYTRTQNK